METGWNKIVVIEGQAESRVLAEQLGLPLTAMPCEGLVLRFNQARLELLSVDPDAPGPVYVDFVGGKVGHRFQFGGGRGQLIAKAVGVKKEHIPTVIDATAGLGRDAFVLASLGCKVKMIERSPIIAALLTDGMKRAAAEPEIAKIISENMQFEAGNAVEYLSQLDEAERPDVVYVDPMHPERSKSALVKKEMRLFRALVGEDLDAPALLETALKAAKKRVVVKRPRKAENIPGPKPGLVFSGKSTRFDVYLVH